MPISDEEAENRRRKREIRENRGEVIPGLNEDPANGLDGPGPEGNFNYGNPGQYGDPNYQYQWGDEFNNPGAEPERGTPEWTEWKAHAKAWRNFIGQRQNAVDSLVSMGYDPEQLGIRPVKEQGLAGWNRLHSRIGEGGGAGGWEYNWATGMKRNIATSDVTARDRWYPISAAERRDYAQNTNYIGILRNRQKEWMKGSDLLFDAASGRYYDPDPGPDGTETRTWFDEYGGVLDAQGNRTGRAYGDDYARSIVTNRHAAEGTGMGSPTAIAQAPSFGTLFSQAGLGGAGVQTSQPRPPTTQNPVSGSSIPGMEDYYNTGNSTVGRTPYERRSGRRTSTRPTGWGQTGFGT